MWNNRIFQFMLLAGLLFPLGCIEKADQPGKVKQPVTISVEEVEIEEVSFPIHSVGKLSARSEIKLSFKTGGIISAIFAEEGQSLSKGAKMAQLDLSEIQATANQANLGLEKARRDLVRIKNLFQDSVATREQYDNVQTAYNLAINQVKIARFNLKYSTISAPSTGHVLKRVAEENEMIAPGHPVFLFAASENDWILKVNLTDREIVQVSLLDSAIISFDAYPGKSFAAWVSEVGSFSDSYTGTYEVELTLRDVGDLLVSGFIGRADIIPNAKHTTMMIPVDALLEASEMNGIVYVVVDNHPVRKRIEISGIRDGKILVSHGLDSGAVVVTDGAAFIRPDSEIRIK